MERFSKQLAVRRVATLPLLGVTVTLARYNLSHPSIETLSLPTGKPRAPILDAKHTPTKTRRA